MQIHTCSTNSARVPVIYTPYLYYHHTSSHNYLLMICGTPNYLKTYYFSNYFAIHFVRILGSMSGRGGGFRHILVCISYTLYLQPFSGIPTSRYAHPHSFDIPAPLLYLPHLHPSGTHAPTSSDIPAPRYIPTPFWYACFCLVYPSCPGLHLGPDIHTHKGHGISHTHSCGEHGARHTHPLPVDRQTLVKITFQQIEISTMHFQG